ncbi:MAG: surface lipoprotein assembly modifier [Pseudomonadota bacterium]
MSRMIQVAAVLLFTAAPGVSQVTLGPDELRQAARTALRVGEPQTALDFGRALIARDAQDLNAHLIVARAARDLGDTRTARDAARTAWTLSETQAQKYAAALVTAQVLATDGKRTRAQLWLRRAAEHAPNDALRARATRDFGYVRQQNPWQTDLIFVFAPNSNINNASNTDRGFIYLDDVPFPLEYTLDVADQAIAGLEFGGSLRSRYRFHQTATTAHDAKIAASYKTYSITDDLGDADVRGSDFAFGSVALGYGYRQINFERRGEMSLDTEAGQTWYGGARYASYLRVSGQQSLIMPGNRRLQFGTNLERQWGQATSDVDTLGLSAGITQAFANGNSGFFGLSAKITDSINANAEYGEVALRTRLSLRKPLAGAAVQIGLGVSFRDYDVSINAPGGRQDNRFFADVTATFKEIDYYGFNPTVTLSASTTNSNVELYDVNRVGLNIGIRSAF